MKRLHAIVLTILAVLVGLAASAAGQEAYLHYDKTRTNRYFAETLMPAPPVGEAANKLAELMKAEVIELAAKDWGPWQLYSHPVNSGDSRMTYLNCPDALLTALAEAYPLLDAEGKKAALAAADREFRKYPPINRPWKPLRAEDRANFRGSYDLPEEVIRRYASGGPRLSGVDDQVAKFKTLYGIWAYAETMDRWDAVRPGWPLIKKLKADLDAGYDFKPQWGGEDGASPGVLSAELAQSDKYQHLLLRYLYNGTHPIETCTNGSPGDERSMNQLAQFNYAKLLSALIAYGRIAEKMGEPAELAWAKAKFNLVAEQALTYRTAPFYWSSPDMTPEVGRMIRDNAGGYLDKVKSRSNVLVGTLANGFPNDGPWYDVIDSHHWFVAHAGSNGAAPLCSPMSGFMSQAYLLKAPADRLDDWTDVPWCQADYWYIRKCAATINAYGEAKFGE